MRIYFAYGSNMSRARLEARVGAVRHLGRAAVIGFAHAFSKLGDDGTGKGNIVATAGTRVIGVGYRLTPEQWDLLLPFESGYHTIEVSMQLEVVGTVGERASTFTARAPVPPLSPTAEYLAHYRQGMAENRFPEDYVAAILAQAGHRT